MAHISPKCCCDEEDQCVDPTCSINGVVAGDDVTITWSSTNADTLTLTIVDRFGVITVTNLGSPSGSTFYSGGACSRYTLRVVKDCEGQADRVATCEWLDLCASDVCGNCQVNTTPSSFVVQFSGVSALGTPGCDCDASRCPQFDNSFAVSNGGSGCVWSGGPFGGFVPACSADSSSKLPFYIDLTVKKGDCDDNNTNNVYAIVSVRYNVLDPHVCVEYPAFQKLLGASTDFVDCGATVPGAYTPCSLFFLERRMCAGDVSVS